jgi:hypothetical protein
MLSEQNVNENYKKKYGIKKNFIKYGISIMLPKRNC